MMSVPWNQWEGQVVDGRFPLRRLLGGTDHSAVFLTQYGEPEPKDAAIKLVLAEAQNSELQAQWEHAAQLSHPHLLRLLHAGSCHTNQTAVHYAVTEYADENLADVLAERALTPVEAREMLQPALDALAYIHHEGLVHGHLKPANLMAVGDQLKLSVDGISRVGDAGTAPSQPGAYDPPEFQDRGASPVGDVWSLGVTLVEALTQRLPTQVDPKQEPLLSEGLPSEFLPIVHLCLEPDPRRRATLRDVLAELRRAEAEAQKPEPAKPAEAPRRSRLPVLVALVAIAIAVILAAPRLLQRAVPNAAVAVAAPVPVPPTPKSGVPEPKAQSKQVPSEKPSPLDPVNAPSTPRTKREARRLQAQAEQVGHGSVLRQVLPEITDKARGSIHGKVTIRVRANVDASGRVTGARVESENSKYFANLTLEAVRQWLFEPAAGEWLLRFEMTSKGTVVQPSRVSP